MRAESLNRCWSLAHALAVAVFVAPRVRLTRDVVRDALPALDASFVEAGGATLCDWRTGAGRAGYLMYVWASRCGVCVAIDGNVDAVARRAPVLAPAMGSGATEAVERGLRWATLVASTGGSSLSLGVDSMPTPIFAGRVRGVTQGCTIDLGIRARVGWPRRGLRGWEHRTSDPDRLDRIVAQARRAADQRDQGYREQALKIYPWICGRCAREFTRANLRELTVHHRDHNHDNNPPDGSNWELLCLYCHDNEHQRQLEAAGPASSSTAGARVSTFAPFADLKALLGRKPPAG